MKEGNDTDRGIHGIENKHVIDYIYKTERCSLKDCSWEFLSSLIRKKMWMHKQAILGIKKETITEILKTK